MLLSVSSNRLRTRYLSVMAAAAAAKDGTTAASKTKARVVVVGAGRMGRIRSELAQANLRLELAGIVDLNVKEAAALASEHETLSFESLDRAIESLSCEESLDGVIVCTPTSSHQAVINAACDYGLAVFTEKPVDETAGKIQQLFEYAAKAQVALCCGFQRRFDSSYVTTQNAVWKDAIGTPVAASLFFADHPVPSRAFLLNGGNIYMDLAAHDIDYITHVLQDEVVKVYATGASSDEELAAAGVHDNATILMTFSKGTTATLFMSRGATYGYDQRCEIFGTKGLIFLNNVPANSTVVANESGIHYSPLQHSFPERFRQAFAAELDAFADTILCGNPWPVTARQCVHVHRVADAAHLSANTGQVISLRHID